MSEVMVRAGDRLSALTETLAGEAVERQYGRRPDLLARWGEQGKSRCREDAVSHLSYLAQALRVEEPSLFSDYLAWVKVLFRSLQIPDGDLMENLRILKELVQESLSFEEARAAGEILDEGMRAFPGLSGESPCFLEGSDDLVGTARRYLDFLLAGDRRGAVSLILEAAEGGVPIRNLYLSVFQPVQREIGRLWQTGKITVAQEHFCTAATQLAMSQLYPRLFTGERKGRRLLAACVSGELHEIGLRMVADFFEMEGWDTYFMGASTPAEGLIRTLEEQDIHVLAISATITPHVDRVKNLVEKVRAHPYGRKVRILVGGHPFNEAPGLWRKLGADGSATTASGAVQTALSLLS
ncbi:MAG: cobalamin-dependent protein [Acidobacteriota bacterium]